MPIFYNTSIPKESSKNNITTVATDFGIRDFLLNLNLKPKYPTISTSLNGSPRIGEPVLETSINDGVNRIPDFLPLETNGIIFKDLNVNINTFKNTSSMSNNLTEINYVDSIPNTDFPNTNWPDTALTYPTTPNDDVVDYGLLAKTTDAEYKKRNVTKNLYLDVTKQIDMADFIGLNNSDMSNQVSGYLDEYGGLNLGRSGSIQAANVIGSVLNGQGLGFGKSGLVTNFDLRSSLAGRVLGATGVINDTKLGTVGGQQLILALGNNAAFNVQQELLGSLNVKENIYSLVKGDGLAGFRPSYKITVPSTAGGRILDTAGKLLGFTIPRSYLDDSGSIFQTENGDAENIQRANSMIRYTGKGQVISLLKNFKANQNGISPNGIDNPENSPFRQGYAPAFTDNKGKVQITNGNLYAYSNDGNFISLLAASDGVIPNLSQQKEQRIKDSGFLSPEDNGTGPKGNTGYDNRKPSDIGFTWTSSTEKTVNSLEKVTLMPGFEGLSGLIAYNDEIIGDKKSLLVKTQKLFNSKGMVNIVSSKGDMGKSSSQIQTANGGGFSKGNAVMKASMFDANTGRYKGKKDATADETYCRSWTTLQRYDTVGKLVRSGIDSLGKPVGGEFDGVGINESVPYRFKTQGSVMDAYGFPKIAPYITDKETDPKKFMFSIENLAWAGDSFTLLPQSEKGPGDLLTGKRGRIMWFPPYNIQFSENSSVNWEANNFIGRGESVYTYNNTERAGNLSFQVIVDHPSYVNSFRGSDGPDDHYINSFWAGCIDPDSKMGEKLTVSERSEVVNGQDIIKQEKVVNPEAVPEPISIYFPNDNVIIEPLYENGLKISDSTPIDYSQNIIGSGQGLGSYKADYTPGLHNNSKQADGEGWPDRYNFGLNYSQETNGSSQTPLTVVGAENFKLRGYFDPQTEDMMVKHLTEICPNCVATITGFASKQGNVKYNEKLALNRAKMMKADIKTKWWPRIKAALPKLTDGDFDKKFKVGKTEEVKEIGCKSCAGIPRARRDIECPTDTLECKRDRRATISFVYDQTQAENSTTQPEPLIKNTRKRITNRITDRYYNESKYFEKLTDVDPLVFDTFREKIRYFHPAFHSTTPEGLNSRLTFLLQCTRQGPTMEEQGATNLAFGRAPVCILRIGDFYNTKIVMDSVSIDYEPLVWDLNPEGIGVQPMIANVTISFKFIGGSTLMGPINKLQNALSFNYFANAQVYDPRADYISKEVPIGKVKAEDGADENGDFVGNGLRPWHLHLGEKDISKLKNEVINEEDLSSEINQEEANEIEISQSTNSTPIEPEVIGGEEQDTKVLECFGLDGLVSVDVSDPEEFDITFRMNWHTTTYAPTPVLTKPYYAFIYIISPDDKNKRVIGHIQVHPNDAHSLMFKVFKDINGKLGAPTTSQLISLVGNNNPNKITIDSDIYGNNLELTAFIKKTYEEKGTIEIQWKDRYLRSMMNFGENVLINKK